ncbi:MAG: glycosyltransferase family 9 protein [Bacteroidetes bacterium]|nr:glycosyltransferase family 9 protein [Bacteroidota bacterium]
MKVLVIRFSSIGDIVLTFPVLRCIKEQIANSEIHFATKKAFSDLAYASGSIDQLHILDGSLSDLSKRLKNEKFDIVIDLHNNLRSRMLCYKLGIKQTYHFRKLNFLKWILVRFKRNYLPKIHVVDRYFEAVNNIGVVNDGRNNTFNLTQELNVRDVLNLEEKSYISIAIGAQFETKQIPIIKIQEIISKIDLPIVLLGGKMDEQKANSIIELLPEKNIKNTCGKYSLLQSAAIVKNSKLLIAGDTGLMHIAACFDIPIYVIWGNTTPSFGMSAYKPQGSDSVHNFEVQNLTCRPCSKIGFDKCPKGHHKCMMNIDESKIVEGITRDLSNK